MRSQALKGPRASPPGLDPVARRLRARRAELGLSVYQLSERTRFADSPGPALSPSYISLIENGHKVPNEGTAVALARALGEDEKIYRAWVRARKRGDLGAVLASVRTLLEDPDLRSRLPALEAPARPSPPIVSGPGAGVPRGAPSPKILVPRIAEGEDPGDGPRPAGEVLEMLRLDPLAMAAAERLTRPFAYRVSEAGVRRVPELLRSGDVVVVSRQALPLGPDDVCAVRAAGLVVLGRALWNGRLLLLLPAAGLSDFEVLDCADAGTLERLVLGRVAAVLRPPR